MMPSTNLQRGTVFCLPTCDEVTNLTQNPNKMKISIEIMQAAVGGSASAFRSRTRLQPAGGEGDKCFPPTYAGAKYATENRQLNGAKVPCVLLDSVQAQANRLEEALQHALDAGTLKGIPVLNVDFTGIGLLDEVGRVSSLEAPHRIADAILRDSLHDGQPFRKSGLGKSLDQASVQNATPLYKLCPTALIFGLWDSTGPKGGLGAKFQRALVSEIIGVNAEIGVKTSSRIDPLGMRAAAKVIKKPDGSYELAGDKAKDAVSPSEVNHGNIPPDVNAAGGAVGIARDPGKPPTEFTITAKDAIKLLEEAVASAEKLGLVWQKEPVKLTPSPNLVALLKRSQDIAAKTPADAAAE